MTLDNLKSTPLCYTKELIDALIELDQAFKCVNTGPTELKYINTLKIDLDNLAKVFPSDDSEISNAELQAFIKKVNDRCIKIRDDENAKRANLESKLETVIDILKKLLAGKLVVPYGGQYHQYIISVDTIQSSQKDKYSLMACGEVLNLYPFMDTSIRYPNELAIWYDDYSIFSVAQKVSWSVQSGTMPVTDKGMICTVDPDDAIEWLEMRKMAYETEHLCKTEWIKSHKQANEQESLKENE